MKGNSIMKRIVALLIAILVAFTFASSSFAADHGEGTFVKSPEMTHEGRVVSAWFNPGEALEIILTPFMNKDVLEKISRTRIETAYNDILHCDILSRICGELDGYSETPVANLAVSNLFDLSWEQGDLSREAHITLGDFDLAHFVALLHYNHEGKWEIVRNITILGKNLNFTINNLSPFAIVVDASAYAEPTSPATGDLFAAVATCGAIALGCGALYFISKSRKKAEEN